MIIADGMIGIYGKGGATASSKAGVLTLMGVPVIRDAGTDYDDNGNPIEHEDVIVESVPCQVVPVSIDRQAKSTLDERIVEASYELYLDYRAFADDVRRLHLTWLGKDCGDFSVIKIEPLEAVQQLKITV